MSLLSSAGSIAVCKLKDEPFNVYHLILAESF